MPWLLKMHGDVADPSSIVLTREQYLEYGDEWAPLTGLVQAMLLPIVLTREQYLEYGDEWAPLTGLVQAMLLTRHVLFVGFSLDDDNFARLAYQVRRVLKRAGAAQGRDGAVAARGPRAQGALGVRPRLPRAWARSQSEEEAAERGRQDRLAARRLEIFLDRLTWRASTTRGGTERFLLDRDYDAMPRAEAEVRLREGLRQLTHKVGPVSRETAAVAARSVRA